MISKLNQQMRVLFLRKLFCRVYWLTLSFNLKWDFSLVPPSASSHSRCAFPAPPSTDFRFLSLQVHIARNALAARIPIKYLAKILCGSSFSFLSFSMCFPCSAVH